MFACRKTRQVRNYRSAWSTTASMKTRRMGRVIAARFTIDLTGDDYELWTRFAERLGLSLRDLVRQSVQLAMMRGSTR